MVGTPLTMHLNVFDNTKNMLQILQTRHELATLLSFADYTEYSLATKVENKDDAFEFGDEGF